MSVRKEDIVGQLNATSMPRCIALAFGFGAFHDGKIGIGGVYDQAR